MKMQRCFPVGRVAALMVASLAVEAAFCAPSTDAWKALLDPPAGYSFQRSVKAAEKYTLKDFDLEYYIQANGPGTAQRVMMAIPKATTARGPLPAVAVPFYFPEAMVGFEPKDGSPLPKFAEIAMMADLAKRGYIAISATAYHLTYVVGSTRPRGDFKRWAEAAQALNRDWPGWTGMGKLAFDTRLLVDMLVADPRVDRNRIGIAGHSLGGKMAIYAGALDSRIKVILASDPGVCWDRSNWDAEWYFGAKLDGMKKAGLDNAGLLAAYGGKPMCLLAGEYDGDWSTELLKSVAPYRENPGRLKVVNPGLGRHRPPQYALEQGYAFLDRHLKNVSPLDELMPAPVRVEAGEGVAQGAALDRVQVTTGPVEGAPAETADESYRLTVSPDGVRIVAPTARGERWARVTLDQLRRLSGGAVPACTITDWPKLKWRGLMLDLSRNFLELEHLRAVIDMMERYKLNMFHMHLTENYCWRLESRRHPELQSEKGRYDPGNSRHTERIYTQKEFVDFVDYAYRHGVTVVPEFDLPGHSAAFRKAFGLEGMRNPRATSIARDLFDELCSLVPADRMPIIHIGTDEVWDEAEKPEDDAYEKWAQTLAGHGRITANWGGGGQGQWWIPCPGRRMLFSWGVGIAGTYTDAGRREADPAMLAKLGNVELIDPWWYIEEYDPFEVLPAATYSTPFMSRYGEKFPHSMKAGAEFCAWHDSAAGLPHTNILSQQQIFPCCVMFGDLFWRCRENPLPEFERRLPLAGDPRLEIARDIERRTIAQRDKALKDLAYPFHFLRQTDMRWRLSHADGRLIAKDIAQATVFPFRKKDKPLNYIPDASGHVVLETWIKSPVDQTVGAWIGFTAYDRDHGRSRAQGTPEQGCWNNVGASITVNGEPVAPPKWENAGLKPGADVPLIKYMHMLDEVPYRNEEYYMREPSRVTLKAGWNHVKLDLPMPYEVNWIWRRQWVGTFIPMVGTTDHPREVEGLEYSSEPPQVPMRMLTFNVYSDWHVEGGGVKPREAGIENTLRKLRPDIAALQEVCRNWWASPMFAHLASDYGIVRGDEADAVRRAGPLPQPKSGKKMPVGCNHNPLLYRKDRLNLLDSGFDIFHIALGGCSKAVTWAVFEDKRNGRRFISFSTHFWFKSNGPESDAIRELNVRHILWRVAEVRRKWGAIPVIGGGDLNSTPGSLAHETFKREGYSNAMHVAKEKTARSATRTYHGYPKTDENGVYHGTVAPPGKDKPEQSIDHIFFTEGIRAMRYDLDLDQETLDSSDHSPVVVDFLITCDPALKQ